MFYIRVQPIRFNVKKDPYYTSIKCFMRGTQSTNSLKNSLQPFYIKIAVKYTQLTNVRAFGVGGPNCCSVSLVVTSRPNTDCSLFQHV